MRVDQHDQRQGGAYDWELVLISNQSRPTGWCTYAHLHIIWGYLFPISDGVVLGGHY